MAGDLWTPIAPMVGVLVGGGLSFLAQRTMDGLRVAEKSVELLCDSSLRAPTARYVRALNQAVWHRRGDTPLGERLEPVKSAFLAAARRSLGPETPGSPEADPPR